LLLCQFVDKVFFPDHFKLTILLKLTITPQTPLGYFWALILVCSKRLCCQNCL